MHKIELRVSLPPDMSERICKALNVESNREIPRTKVDIINENGVILRISATDTHALRAAVNSYMRWLNLALDIEEVIEDGS